LAGNGVVAIAPFRDRRETTAVFSGLIAVVWSLAPSVTHIEARPGEKLHSQFRNAGTLPKAVMGHNWVLLKAGSDAMPYI